MMSDERKEARTSVASYALIQPKDGTQQWLLQWNSKWKAMNLVSGHKEDSDANDLTCIIREIHEELFQNLSPERLEELQKALGSDNAVYARDKSSWKDDYISAVRMRGEGPFEYVDFSDSKKVWTKYVLHVYDVVLTDEGYEKLFHEYPFYSPDSVLRPSPKNPNEWVSLDDVQKGWTVMSRPVSRTVKKIFHELGLI
jgi:predicted lipoprotein with Yx(FWY)xxD motif